MIRCSVPPRRPAGKRIRRRPPDRKSTRLNSSHRCISYAVFCLKKKNDLAVLVAPDLPSHVSVEPQILRLGAGTQRVRTELADHRVDLPGECVGGVDVVSVTERV